MAELEIQMSQVLGRLNGLAETLGSVMERIDSIEDDITISSPEERNTSLWSKVSVPCTSALCSYTLIFAITA